jgi:hypothetical protein
MIYLSLSDNLILLDQFLTLSQSQNRYRYTVREVTYFADKRYHDGIKTGSKTMHEGLLPEQGPRFSNSKLRDGPAREAVSLLHSCVNV